MIIDYLIITDMPIFITLLLTNIILQLIIYFISSEKNKVSIINMTHSENHYSG